METHRSKLSNSFPCNSEIAKRLRKNKVRPCTYYAYVEAGSGIFSCIQIVKTNDALRSKYKYPAMTDYEAEYFLFNRIQGWDDKTIIINRPKRKARISLKENEWDNCISRTDKLCTIICILLEKGIYGFHEVHNSMEALKIQRNMEG